MIKNFFGRFILVVFLGLITFIANAQSTDLKDVTVRPILKSDKEWFIKKFPISFMSVYQDKVFIINKDSKPVVLSQSDIQSKYEWLLDTAKEEFQDYVLAPQPGFVGIVIEYNKKPIGALLYRLLNNEKTIYLAQYFIVPEQQKKGIGLHVLVNVLPAMHPEYKRYEILARHQNDAALLLYKRANFAVGDIAIVQKYDYDPLRYMSFYKVIN